MTFWLIMTSIHDVFKRAQWSKWKSYSRFISSRQLAIRFPFKSQNTTMTFSRALTCTRSCSYWRRRCTLTPRSSAQDQTEPNQTASGGNVLWPGCFRRLWPVCLWQTPARRSRVWGWIFPAVSALRLSCVTSLSWSLVWGHWRSFRSSDPCLSIPFVFLVMPFCSI